MTFELEGQLDLAQGYHLDVVPQPVVNPDEVHVNIEGLPGASGGGRRVDLDELRADRAIDVTLGE